MKPAEHTHHPSPPSTTNQNETKPNQTERNPKTALSQEEAIEEEINHGQLEELLVDGKNELKLIDKYAEWRLWEAVDELNKERQET